MNKLTPTFLLVAVALLVWLLSVSLSSYLAKSSPSSKSEHQGAVASSEISEKIKTLKAAVSSDPQNIAKKVQLAEALRMEAFQNSNTTLLMEAVREYSEALKIDAENPEALRGMAELSLEAGIIDKALEYFPKYLKKQPNDLREKTNYSLALLQAGNAEAAVAELEDALRQDSKYFPAHLTLALVYKVTGDLARARAKILQARELAPDEEARRRIDDFVKRLDQPQDKVQAKDLSPAETVADYFRSHSIIGPKIKRIVWPSLLEVNIFVENFPVEQMPPFAKEKFINSTKEKLRILSEVTRVRILDALSAKELLVIEVGGDKVN